MPRLTGIAMTSVSPDPQMVPVERLRHGLVTDQFNVIGLTMSATNNSADNARNSPATT